MFKDEFKERYTTIPFAIYKAYSLNGAKEVITHQHGEVELICMTEGAAVFYIDSQRYEIKAGDSLVIPPYALHRAQVVENVPTSYYCICFAPSLLCDEELRQGLEGQSVVLCNPIVKGTALGRQAGESIETAFLACERQMLGWELTATGNLSLLFGALKGGDFFRQSTGASKDVNFGKDAMAYIIGNYAERISSRDAAEALYMDHSSFCRRFKRTFGTCFTDYVLSYRLEKAKVYLQTTERPITEIAFRVGFNDCSYFCKVFRERVGIPPLSFRKTRER